RGVTLDRGGLHPVDEVKVMAVDMFALSCRRLFRSSLKSEKVEQPQEVVASGHVLETQPQPRNIRARGQVQSESMHFGPVIQAALERAQRWPALDVVGESHAGVRRM